MPTIKVFVPPPIPDRMQCSTVEPVMPETVVPAMLIKVQLLTTPEHEIPVTDVPLTAWTLQFPAMAYALIPVTVAPPERL